MEQDKKACPKPDPGSCNEKGDPWFHVFDAGVQSAQMCRELVVDYEEDVMLRMGFGDDVAAVDAASSSHFVPLSAMMRNHTVSDRPVPGESKGPEKRRLFSEAAWRTDRREDAAGSSPICSNGRHWP